MARTGQASRWIAVGSPRACCTQVVAQALSPESAASTWLPDCVDTADAPTASRAGGTAHAPWLTCFLRGGAAHSSAVSEDIPHASK